VEILKQNNNQSMSLSKIKKMMDEQGWRHTYDAIRDNYKVLLQNDVLKESDNGCVISPGFDNDLERLDRRRFNHGGRFNHKEFIGKKISKLPPPLEPYEYYNYKCGYCDKCGRKFERGDKFYIKRFSNTQLVLCEDCHAPKIMV
jgi:hypothetical protein